MTHRSNTEQNEENKQWQQTFVTEFGHWFKEDLVEVVPK